MPHVSIALVAFMGPKRLSDVASYCCANGHVFLFPSRLFKSVFDWGFQSEDEKVVSSDGIYLCRGKVGLFVVRCKMR